MSLFGWLGWDFKLISEYDFTAQKMMNYANKSAQNCVNRPDISSAGTNSIKDERFKKHFETRLPLYGVIRIEEWPEGLVIWVGGVIVYRSWK